MKKHLQTMTLLLMFLLISVLFCSCGNSGENPKTDTDFFDPNKQTYSYNGTVMYPSYTVENYYLNRLPYDVDYDQNKLPVLLHSDVWIENCHSETTFKSFLETFGRPVGFIVSDVASKTSWAQYTTSDGYLVYVRFKESWESGKLVDVVVSVVRLSKPGDETGEYTKELIFR